MATYGGSHTLSAAEDCLDLHLAEWNGCACQPSKPLTNDMCTQDSLWKSSDETETEDQQTDWSEEEDIFEKAGMLSFVCFPLWQYKALCESELLRIVGLAVNRHGCEGRERDGKREVNTGDLEIYGLSAVGIASRGQQPPPAAA